jgi:hypothetical protein
LKPNGGSHAHENLSLYAEDTISNASAEDSIFSSCRIAVCSPEIESSDDWVFCVGFDHLGKQFAEDELFREILGTYPDRCGLLRTSGKDHSQGQEDQKPEYAEEQGGLALDRRG